MPKPNTRRLLLSLAVAVAAVGGSAANATFEQGSIACENQIAERFPGASMADITASTPYHKSHSQARIDWSVTTENESAMGYCKVNRSGTVLRVKVEHHKRYQRHADNDATEGFYYDRRSGHWRQDDNDEVCYSCTPENGFPKHGGR